MSICIVPEKNLLLIVDVEGLFFLKAYNLNTLTYIKSFVKKGAQPNEQISCRDLSYEIGKGLLYTSDPFKRKIFIYKLDDIIAPGTNVYPVADMSLQSKFYVHPIVSQNSIIDFHPNIQGRKEGVLDWYSKDGTFVKTTGTYPSIQKKYSGNELNFAFLSGINLSKENDKVILNYFHTDYLEIYDTLGNLKNRVQGPDIFSPDVLKESRYGGEFDRINEGAMIGYAAKAQLHNNDLYVLYNGEKLSREYHVNTLLNFDAKLKPKRSLTLDKPIFAFDIDWGKNTLYGLTHLYKENVLVKYQLK